MVTKKDMLERMKSGSEEDWQAFYRKYWEWLLAHARTDIHRQEDAKDVCQIVLVKVAKAMPRFEYDPNFGSFRGWLMTILKREVISFFRKKKLPLIDDLKPDSPTSRRTSRTSRIPDEPPSHWPNDLGRQHLQEVIDQSLGQLRSKVTPEAFEMFQRHYFLDESSEAIALRSGRTLNAVYTSTSRTLRQFRILFRRNLEA